MCTEQLSRLPRHLLCYLCNDPLSCSQGLQDTFLCSTSNALLLSTELLSRCEDTLSIQSASFLLCVLSSSQGPRHLLCYLCNDPLSCSQGLQETFSALCIVVLQAPIPTMIGPCLHFKEGFRRHLFHHPIILHKGFAREGFSECSSSSFNQPDAVPETNR